MSPIKSPNRPANMNKLCQDKANQLLLDYRGEYTTAGVMLLVYDAVREGAELGLDAAEKAILGEPV